MGRSISRSLTKKNKNVPDNFFKSTNSDVGEDAQEEFTGSIMQKIN